MRIVKQKGNNSVNPGDDFQLEHTGTLCVCVCVYVEGRGCCWGKFDVESSLGPKERMASEWTKVIKMASEATL